MTTATDTKTRPGPPKLDRMPPWRVLLHNDDQNDMGYVVDSIVEIVAMKQNDAIVAMLEAHQKGLTLLKVTHREHAELIEDRFRSKKLTVTIEPEA